MSDMFTVGQTVIVTDRHGRRKPTAAVVVKVGREYVYTGTTLEDRRPRKFRMDTGEESRRGGYVGGWLYTEQEWAGRNFRAALIHLLGEQGIRIDPRGRHLTTGQLEQMAAAITDPAQIRARDEEDALADTEGDPE